MPVTLAGRRLVVLLTLALCALLVQFGAATLAHAEFHVDDGVSMPAVAVDDVGQAVALWRVREDNGAHTALLSRRSRAADEWSALTIVDPLQPDALSVPVIAAWSSPVSVDRG